MSLSQSNIPFESGSLKKRASHLVEEDIIEPAQYYFKKAKRYGAKAIDRGSEIVRENPGYTVLGAATFGFLCGAYMARRK